MKVAIESEQIVVFEGLEHRRWRGHTESGTPVVLFVRAITPVVPPNDPREREFLDELALQPEMIPAGLVIP